MDLSKPINAMLQMIGLKIVRPGKVNRLDETFLGAQYAYDTIVTGDFYAPWHLDQDFLSIYNEVTNYTLVDVYRCWELFDAVREVRKVPGNLLEVGVWRGGTGAILARAARKWKPEATVFLCDTFQGVVKAGANDATYRGGEHSDTSLLTVACLMERLGIQDTVLLQGIFPEETAHKIPDQGISLCHIDVDVYQSAMDVLSWVEPRMRPGGMVILDDYGFSTCKGITKLINEWREHDGWRFIYNLNGHALLLKY